MNLNINRDNGYLYVLQCIGGVTKFGRALDPPSRLSAYRNQKEQNQFRCSKDTTYSFLWECERGDYETLELRSLWYLRRRFLTVRNEGFILEKPDDMAEMVASIAEAVMSCGGSIARRDPNLAFASAQKFARKSVEMSAAPSTQVPSKTFQPADPVKAIPMKPIAANGGGSYFCD